MPYFPPVSSGGTTAPGGSDGQLQYNNGGAFGGASGLFYDDANGKFGFGTVTPDEKLHVLGNFQVDDAETPTKGYRFRTSGGNLDLDASGADLFISVFSGAGFTGTQRDKMRLIAGSDEVKAIDKWHFTDGPYGGTQHEIDGNAGATFNEQGLATGDVRIEGDTDANLFFTDASADFVGIGTNAPASKLHAVGDIESSGANKGIILADRTGGARYRLYINGGTLMLEAA